MESNRKAGYLLVVLGTILAYFTYMFVLKELPNTLSDYNGHTYVYLKLMMGPRPLEGWAAAPYCLWHVTVIMLNKLAGVPLDSSAALSSCIYALFFFLTAYHFFYKWSGREDAKVKSVVLAFFVSFLQGIYLSWVLSGNGYAGIFSMNPHHNPTQMCVRGFGLMCFMLVADIWERTKNPEFKGRFFTIGDKLTGHYVLLAVFLFLSAAAKPTFAEMFIPAVAFTMLVVWIIKIVKKQEAGAYFKECLKMLLAAAPALLYILVQFLAYFIFGGSYGEGGSFVITTPFEAWRYYSDNIVLSIVLGMAFPLYVILTDAGFFFKNLVGRLALVGYFVGLLEAAFLGEKEKMDSGDFLWPMMSGMLLLWVVSVARFTENEEKDIKHRLMYIIGWAIFALHVLYGVIGLTGLQI